MTHGISRRQALGAFGTVGLGTLLAACGGNGDGAATTSAEVETTEGSTTTVSPQAASSAATADLFEGAATCTLTRELTEGPYYFDVDSIRSDIREDREGAALRLAVRVRNAEECTPLANAVVDVWHCDALGTYSGFESASEGADSAGAPPAGDNPGEAPGSGGPPPGGGGGGGANRTDEETYLRGAQVTNADGIVEFLTVYPGWYRGRTVHVHAKVHVDNSTVLTTQLFFDEAVSEAVYATEPYSTDSGRDTFNDDDGIFDESLVLTLSQDGDGYLGVITFDVEPA